MIDRLRPTVRRLLRLLVRARHARRALRALAQRGLLPEAIWRRLPVETTFGVEAKGVAFVYRSERDDDIGRFLYWTGLRCYERETVAVFLALISRPRRFVDVGANTGLFTLLACGANPAISVIALEPVPRVFERLRDNVGLSGFAGRCRLCQVAAADRAGLARLHVPHADLPKSAKLGMQGFRGLAGDLIEVPTTTVDDLRREHGPIDLVKIDIEGGEPLALAGMQTTLARDRPVLILECHADGPVTAVQSEIERAGYAAFHCRAEGPRRTPRVLPDPRQRYSNWLCVPREHADAIATMFAMGTAQRGI